MEIARLIPPKTAVTRLSTYIHLVAAEGYTLIDISSLWSEAE